jgi:hypothetical protein
MLTVHTVHLVHLWSTLCTLGILCAHYAHCAPMSTLCTLCTLQAHCAHCAHYAHCAPLSILCTLCTLRAHCAYCAHFVHCAPLSTLCTLCTLHPKEVKCAQVCTIKDPSASMLPAGLWHQNLAGCGLPVATILPMHPGKAVLQNKSTVIVIVCTPVYTCSIVTVSEAQNWNAGDLSVLTCRPILL